MIPHNWSWCLIRQEIENAQGCSLECAKEMLDNILTFEGYDIW